MIGRAVFVACLIASLAGVERAAAAEAQDPVLPFLGRPVADVRLEIESQPSLSVDLLALIDVRAGQPLRRSDIRSSIGRLLSPGLARFDDVVVLVEPAGDGVRVLFRLTPRHAVVDLAITGASGIDAAELRRLVLARYGGLPARERLANIEAATERILADRGYLDAEVTARPSQQHQPHQATLVLDVAAGAPAILGQVDVTGTSPLSVETILKRAAVQPGGAYRRRDVQTRLDAIANELRAERYYEAVARPTETRGADGRVALTLFVNAGPLVDLRFTGDPLPPGRQTDLVPIERERSADDDLLEDSRRRIESALRGLGHKDARVVYTRVEADGGTRLLLTFNVTRGPRFVVGAVEWPAGLSVPSSELAEALAVVPGEPYNAAAVDAGLSRVRALYLRRGFYAVDVRPEIAVVPAGAPAAAPRVDLKPAIVEGPLGTIREVAIEAVGTQAVAPTALREVMRARAGLPFVVSDVILDQRAIVQRFLDLGYRTPAVQIREERSNDGRDVRLIVAVNEGPRILVESIVVVGNRRISAESVLDEVTLRPGEPFSAAEEVESVRRLRAVGIFRSVSILSEGVTPASTRASLIVAVEELPAIAVGFGGGLEVGRGPRRAGDTLVEQAQLAPRGFFDVTRRNLGGRNRSISLFSRLALKPRTRSDTTPESDRRRFGFAEYRVTGTFTEQRAFGTETGVLIGLTSEQAIRTSFKFRRQRANAEALRPIRPGLTWFGRYALDFSRLFDELIDEDEQPLIDRLFPQVRLSILSTGMSWDRRDQILSPTRGTFATGDVEVALRGIGSQVGYVKTFLQVSGFRRLTSSDRAVAAGRVQVGLARGFERIATVEDADGNPVLGPDGQPLTELVADLPASQRFFAGGGTTVRGFQLDRLGVSRVLTANGLSRGGNGLVVLNGELRAAAARILGRQLSVVGFADGGNVFAQAGDVDLKRLRAALGFGVRYDSPLGPLRLDFGFKLGRRLIGGVRERGWEYHLSIGEIF